MPPAKSNSIAKLPAASQPIEQAQLVCEDALGRRAPVVQGSGALPLASPAARKLVGRQIAGQINLAPSAPLPLRGLRPSPIPSPRRGSGIFLSPLPRADARGYIPSLPSGRKAGEVWRRGSKPQAHASALPEILGERVLQNWQSRCLRGRSLRHGSKPVSSRPLAEVYRRVSKTYRRLPITYRRLSGTYRRAAITYNRLAITYSRLPLTYRRLPGTYSRLS